MVITGGSPVPHRAAQEGEGGQGAHGRRDGGRASGPAGRGGRAALAAGQRAGPGARGHRGAGDGAEGVDDAVLVEQAEADWAVGQLLLQAVTSSGPALG